MDRTSTLHRKTSETDITLSLNLDGPPTSHAAAERGFASEAAGISPRSIATGVGFFDHMLTAVAKHGRLGLSVTCTGDTHIDDHHSVEDVGIVLGQALADALGDKRGIERYGSATVPMDETLARVALDLSGRAALVYHVHFQAFGDDPAAIGRFDVQLIKEFFVAVAHNAKMNLHIEVPWGENNHHIAEAIFKAFARALRQAVAITGDEVPSTKGAL